MAALSAFLPASAGAADCPGVFSYGTYGVTCDEGGADICAYDAGDLVCDLGRNGETVDATGYFVMYDADEFLAYGFDGTGTEFCCPFDFGNGTPDLDVYGTWLNDTIELLDTVSGKTMTGSTTTIYADEGDDFIGGSTSTGNTDICYGGANADTFHGRQGGDTFYGESGEDTFYGGDGADTAQLGTDNDRAKGGDGVDTINGNEGNDAICGELGSDYLYGDQGDLDKVYGGIEDDVAVRGDGGTNDECEDDADYTGCETRNLTSCPW